MEFVESSDSSEDDNEIQNFVELIANGCDNSEVLSTAQVFEMMELETERVHSVLKVNIKNKPSKSLTDLIENESFI